MYENGTGYSAVIGIVDAEEYRFTEPGLLGEAVSIQARNISLTDGSGDVVLSADGESRITFPRGDYLLFYEGTLSGNSFAAVFSDRHNITVFLPEGYDVRNPLLGYVSQGGKTTVTDKGLMITWEKTRYADIRYYDETREVILYAFGTIWIMLMIILLFGYYAMRVSTKE